MQKCVFCSIPDCCVMESTASFINKDVFTSCCFSIVRMFLCNVVYSWIEPSIPEYFWGRC